MKTLRSKGYEELAQELKRGVIRRGYLLIGEEFQREEALDMLLDTVVAPRMRVFNLDVFTAGEADIGAMINAALSPPMMVERRVVVIKGCERFNSTDWKRCAPLVTDWPASTCLILSGEKVDDRKKIVDNSRKGMEVFEFKTLYDKDIPRWIEHRARGMEKPITSPAAALLHVQVGNRLRDLANELEKLSIFVGDRERIEVEDVEAAVGCSAVSSIFKLTDAVGHRQRKVAIVLVNRLLDDGQSSTGMVAMIGRHLVILSKLLAAQRTGVPRRQLQEITGAHPYFLDTYIAQTQYFDEQQLLNGLDAVLASEDALKSGSSRDRLVLEQLIYRLC